jgi:hypothetical protein
VINGMGQPSAGAFSYRRGGPGRNATKINQFRNFSPRGGSAEAPALYPPDCPITERDAAIAAFDAICAARPKKPPGR